METSKDSSHLVRQDNDVTVLRNRASSGINLNSAEPLVAVANAVPITQTQEENEATITSPNTDINTACSVDPVLTGNHDPQDETHQSEEENSEMSDPNHANHANTLGVTINPIPTEDSLDTLLSKQKHISTEEMQYWKKDFDEFVIEYCRDLGSNSTLLTNEIYDELLQIVPEITKHIQSAYVERLEQARMKTHFLKTNNPTNHKMAVEGFKKAEQKYQQLLRWKKNYEILPTGGLIRAGYDSLDKAFKVSCPRIFFQDIWKCHFELSSHRSINATWIEVKRRHGTTIPRKIVRRFYRGCATCVISATSTKPPAGTKPIVAKSFLNRIQMDLVEMKAFRGGLHEAFQDLSKESQTNLGGMEKSDFVSLVPENAVPSYICNIADHASKVGKSYAIANKKPESVALCLLDFISTYGVPAVSNML